MKKQKKTLIENWCKKCGSYYTYQTQHEIVCRKCGFRAERDEVLGNLKGERPSAKTAGHSLSQTGDGSRA